MSGRGEARILVVDDVPENVCALNPDTLIGALARRFDATGFLQGDGVQPRGACEPVLRAQRLTPFDGPT